MRVLVDSEIYRLQATGGISRIFTESLARIASFLPEIDIRFTWLENHFKGRLPKAPGIRRPLDFRPRRFEQALNTSMQRRWDPQIFHSTYFTVPSLRGVRKVVTVYDFIYEEFSTLTGCHNHILEQKRTALRGADSIVAISQSTKEGTLRHIGGPEERVRVIYPGVAGVFLAEEPADAGGRGRLRAAIGNDRPFWLYVGNRKFYKNFGTLLRAFSRVAPRADADLVVIGGEADLADWQIDLLISKGLEKRVHLLGPVDDVLLIAGYRETAAFVFPSCAEGFGIPLLEAMACKAPILAADIPVFREIASGRARFFDPHDESALAELLLESLDRRPGQAELEAARQDASRFSWDAAARELAGVYRSLAS